MAKALVKLALILLIGSILLGCGQPHNFTERASQPSALIADFSSYASADDVKSVLKDTSISVEEDSQLDPGDQRPPFNILVWSISFEHLNQPGKLHLHFFNDRLMSTWFYPDDMKSYLRALDRSGVALDRDGHCEQPPFTEIWKSTDFKNRGYVGWEDKRLQEECSEWIESYS